MKSEKIEESYENLVTSSKLSGMHLMHEGVLEELIKRAEGVGGKMIYTLEEISALLRYVNIQVEEKIKGIKRIDEETN